MTEAMKDIDLRKVDRSTLRDRSTVRTEHKAADLVMQFLFLTQAYCSAGSPGLLRMSGPGKVKGVDAVLDGLAFVRKTQLHDHAAVQIDIGVAKLFYPCPDALLCGCLRVNADCAAVTERRSIHLAEVDVFHR